MRQANHQNIDPRYITGELPRGELLNILKKNLPTNIQVFAFLIDFDKKYGVRAMVLAPIRLLSCQEYYRHSLRNLIIVIKKAY